MKLNEIHSSEAVGIPQDVQIALDNDRANWDSKDQWLMSVDASGFPDSITQLLTRHNVNMEQLFQYIEDEME